MHKYENCIIKCENKKALRKLYNKLTEIGIEEFNSELYTDELYDQDRIDEIYSNTKFNQDKNIWMLIEYQDYSIGPFPPGYVFSFKHMEDLENKSAYGSTLIDWTKLEEIPYYNFFREEKLERIIKKD